MRRVALALALLPACAPHFRRDADDARRAMDAGELQELLDAAEGEVASGDHEGAVEAYLEAIDVNPRFSAGVYLALARELVDAGDPVRAVAVTRFVVSQRAAELGEGAAVDAVAGRLAAAGLSALALDVLAQQGGGSPEPSAVSRIPALDERVGGLLRAREHAIARRRAEALRAYEEWVAEYGVADHDLLRRWAEEVVAGDGAAREAVRASAQRAWAAGDFELATRTHGVLLAYEPRSGPAEAAAFVEASRRAGDRLRLAPAAAREVSDAFRAAEAGQLGGAIESSRRAVQGAPWHPDLRRNLAELLAAVEMWGEAARQGEWAVALRPDDSSMRERVAAWRARSEAR